MSKLLKGFLIILVLLIIAILIFKIYNENTYNRELKKLNSTGVIEKNVTLPDGSVINYGELGNSDKKLLLIHGQETSWEDYVNVLGELSKDYHVYAIDCYGHGGSSKNPEKYPIVEQSNDLIWFIDRVIKSKVTISGHSSGGLIATYIASIAPDKINGLLIEDSPFFSTEDGRAQKTFAWQGFKVMNDFLESNEKSYFIYSLENNYMKNMFNKNGKDNWQKIVVEPALAEFKKNPNKIPFIWYYPNSLHINDIYKISASMQDGLGDYDLRFGQMFYNFSWFREFDQEEALKSVQCPSVLLHVAKPKGQDSYYDDNGILISAMDEKDAKKVDDLLPNNLLIDNIEGSSHDIHRDKPEAFIEGMKRLEEKVVLH